MAHTALQLIILRLLGGLALGGLWGICAAYLNETWPPRQRAIATSVVIGAMQAGQGVAAALAALVIPRYGWRVLFLIGGTAAFWAIFVYLFMPESDTWKQDTRAGSGSEVKDRVLIRELFSRQLIGRTIAGTVAASCALTASWGAATWFPTFLVRERAWSTASMAQWVMVASAGGYCGFLLTGYLADKIGRKTVLCAICLVGVLALPSVVLSPSMGLAFAGGAFYGAAKSYAGIFGTVFAEMYPTRIRTLGSCFCFNCGRGVSAFGPLTLGIIATRYSLGAGIIACAASYFLAGIAVTFLPKTGQNLARTVKDGGTADQYREVKIGR